MNTKRKVTRNEDCSIRLLEAAGYAYTRAAASLKLVHRWRDWQGQLNMKEIGTRP